MLVSVIITTRNEERHIGNCLQAVQSQTWPEIEAIVVDNASTDRTKEIAREYTDLVFDKGPERSAQRNFGILEAASGEYALFLDADMIPAPCLAERCVEHLQADDLAALHVPEIVLGKGFWSSVRRFERGFYDGTVIDAVRFFRRDVFARVGGFDTSLTGPEDWDLDKRLKELGSLGLLPVGAPCALSGSLAKIVRDNGVNPENYGAVVFHNEAAFSLRRYLSKKHYYAGSFDAYSAKWGARDKDVRRQLGLWYRFFGVFLDSGKWRRLLCHPLRAMGMYFLRFLVGLTFVFRSGRQSEE